MCLSLYLWPVSTWFRPSCINGPSAAHPSISCPFSHKQSTSFQTLLTCSLATCTHPSIHPSSSSSCCRPCNSSAYVPSVLFALHLKLILCHILVMFQTSHQIYESSQRLLERNGPNVGTPDLNLIIWRLMEPLFSVELSWPCPLFMMWRNRMTLMRQGGGRAGGCRIDFVITITASCYTGISHLSA